MNVIGLSDQIATAKAILRDEHPLWEQLIFDVNCALQGEDRLLPSTQVVEFCNDVETAVLAGIRLRGRGYRTFVDRQLMIRIARVCRYATFLHRLGRTVSLSSQSIIRLALSRDSRIASNLLKLGCERALHRSSRRKLILALEDLGSVTNVRSARRVIRNRYESMLGILRKTRMRRHNTSVECGPLTDFTSAVLCEEGIRLQTLDRGELVVSLKKRHLRLLAAGWIASVKNAASPFPNEPRVLFIESRKLKVLIGTCASRTNISQLRRAITFEGANNFLNIDPADTALPVRVGFRFLGSESTILPSDVSQIAIKYKVET